MMKMERSTLMPELQRIVGTTIEENDAGKRLDVFLTERFTYHSRNEWRKNIEKGLLLLNGDKSKPSRKLRAGDKIEYIISEVEEPESDLSYEVVHEDEFIVIVNKSGNLPCHPAGPFFKNTLWHLLMMKFGKIHLVNRIDRETSGLVIAARSPAMASALSAEGAITSKKYLVLVHGIFHSEYHAKGWLLPDGKSEIRKKRKFIGDKIADMDDAETAETKFRLIGSGSGISLVEAELFTGRLHQIRATLHSLGFPVVGDKIYGLDENIYIRFVNRNMNTEDIGKLIIPRQALHSFKLGFVHPQTKKGISLEAGIPDDMKRIIPAGCLGIGGVVC